MRHPATLTESPAGAGRRGGASSPASSPADLTCSAVELGECGKKEPPTSREADGAGALFSGRPWPSEEQECCDYDHGILRWLSQGGRFGPGLRQTIRCGAKFRLEQVSVLQSPAEAA